MGKNHWVATFKPHYVFTRNGGLVKQFVYFVLFLAVLAFSFANINLFSIIIF